MAFYLYVANQGGRAGTIVGAFEDAQAAAEEQAITGGTVIEGPKPSYKHLHSYIAKGWTKCPSCGRPTPPWRQDGAAPQAASAESEK